MPCVVFLEASVTSLTNNSKGGIPHLAPMFSEGSTAHPFKAPVFKACLIKKAIIIRFKKIYIISDITRRRTLQGEFLHMKLTVEIIKEKKQSRLNKIILRVDLATETRIASNAQSSCLSLPSAIL